MGQAHHTIPNHSNSWKSESTMATTTTEKRTAFDLSTKLIRKEEKHIFHFPFHQNKNSENFLKTNSIFFMYKMEYLLSPLQLILHSHGISLSICETINWVRGNLYPISSTNYVNKILLYFFCVSKCTQSCYQSHIIRKNRRLTQNCLKLKVGNQWLNSDKTLVHRFTYSK